MPILNYLQVLRTRSSTNLQMILLTKNIRDLKIEFGIDNIPIDNHRLPNMFFIPKLHKNLIKAKFIHCVS